MGVALAAEAKDRGLLLSDLVPNVRLAVYPGHLTSVPRPGHRPEPYQVLHFVAQGVEPGLHPLRPAGRHYRAALLVGLDPRPGRGLAPAARARPEQRDFHGLVGY